MKFTRIRLCAAAGVMALASAAGVTAVLAGPASAGTSPVAVNCAGHGQIRPATFDNFGCMPSSEYLTGLTWDTWAPVAIGQGTLKVNKCLPTCAAGHYASYPVHVELWRARNRPNHLGQRYFSRLTWTFTGRHPAHTPAIQTLKVSPQS